MEEKIYSEVVNGYLVEVDSDPFALDPRDEEFSNLGKWVCSHRRYNFPNEIGFDFTECNSWSEVEGALSRRFDYVFPLFLYDHSRLAFSLGGYGKGWWHARWDAGQVGFVVANKSDVRAWFGVKKITKKIEEQFFNTLQGEVEAFQAYVNGEVYQVTITDEADGELIDFCGSFYSAEEALKSGRETAEGCGGRQALIAAKVEHPELVSY